jgi:predicted membrane channel-forming protein YqfA (hemolysin III family)
MLTVVTIVVVTVVEADGEQEIPGHEIMFLVGLLLKVMCRSFWHFPRHTSPRMRQFVLAETPF